MTTSAAHRIELGPMPVDQPMEVVDRQFVHSPVSTIFDLAKQVELWPTHLSHYRYVRFRSRRPDGGGEVEMSAYRPFPLAGTRLNWPTWWLSEMSVSPEKHSIRFRHIGGITKGMEVEWTFLPGPNGAHVRIVHVWTGPRIPVIGRWAAVYIIGPIFVHGIASRTLAGLASVAEQIANRRPS
jgi:ribosome-associated toxin RatA of RatAB toxin-antitoxin module